MDKRRTNVLFEMCEDLMTFTWWFADAMARNWASIPKTEYLFASSNTFLNKDWTTSMKCRPSMGGLA